MGFIERYRAGEREQVWDDLRSLGHAVLNGQHAEDARRVTVETMGRARAAFDHLANSLRSLGYEFARG